MKDLLNRFKPVLRKEGVFYPNFIKEDPSCVLVLEEINREAKNIEDHLNGKRKVLGFSAHHKINGNPYLHNSTISRGIGNPKIYLIFCGSEPVDYASNSEGAIEKAHEYLFNKILEGILEHSTEVCNSLLDTTQIGREKFNKKYNNKANLSAQVLEEL